MIDLYCERTGPGLLAEPLNLVSNLAFLVTAWALWRGTGRWRTPSPRTGLLLASIVAVGAGSALFHAFATPWAQGLDVLAIGFFMALFVGSYLRERVRLGRATTAAFVGGFLALAVLAGLSPGLHGSAGYLPALGVLSALGFHHVRKASAGRWDLLAAASLFLLALAFRTVDHLWCPEWRHGTHFLWHLANAGVVFLAARALIRSAE